MFCALSQNYQHFLLLLLLLKECMHLANCQKELKMSKLNFGRPSTFFKVMDLSSQNNVLIKNSRTDWPIYVKAIF